MTTLIITALVIALIVVIYKSERDFLVECFEILTENLGAFGTKLKNDVQLVGYEYLEAIKSLWSPIKGTAQLIAIPFLVIGLILLVIFGAIYRSVTK